MLLFLTPSITAKETPSSIFFGEVIAPSAGESIFYGEMVEAPSYTFFGEVLADTDLPDVQIKFIARQQNTDFGDIIGAQVHRNNILRLLAIPSASLASNTVAAYRMPAHGTLEFVEETAGLMLVYTPDLNFTGWDQLGFTVFRNGAVAASATYIIGVAPINAGSITLDTIPDVLLPFNTLANIDLDDYITNPDSVPIDVLVDPISGAVKSFEPTSHVVVFESTGQVAQQSVTVKLVDRADGTTVYAERTFTVSTEANPQATFRDIPLQTIVINEIPKTIDLGEYLQTTGDTYWLVKQTQNVATTINGNNLTLSALPSASVGITGSFVIALLDSATNIELKAQQVPVRILAANTKATFRIRVWADDQLLLNVPYTVCPAEELTEAIQQSLPIPYQPNVNLRAEVIREDDSTVFASSIIGSVTLVETVEDQ